MNNYKEDSSLTMYRAPPNYVINLEELEEWCLERLNLYKILVEADTRNLKTYSANWTEHIETELQKKQCKNYVVLLNAQSTSLENVLKACKVDEIAHWILCLAYSEKKDNSEFFIARELEWFFLRYKKVPMQEFLQFMRQENVKFSLLHEQDKTLILEELRESSAKDEESIINDPFYQVPWTDVPQLLSERKVLVRGGVAYLPQCQLIDCMLYQLWCLIHRKLASIDLQVNFTDERIHLLLKRLPIIHKTTKCHVTLPTDREAINLENINDQVALFFPPCMKQIHDYLRNNHHIKYDAKMQLGIYLKSIGMPYEDALEYWRNEFTQKIPERKYDKQYEYLFKHQYGKVGGKIDYQPLTCNEIIAAHVGPGQCHGCPFKHSDSEHLTEFLLQQECFRSEHLLDIEDLIKNNKYKKACTTYFNACNSTAYPQEEMEAPHLFFQQSQCSYDYQTDDILSTLLKDL